MKYPFENKKVIVRSPKAGVFYGEIAEKDGDEVLMRNARCLWYYTGAATLNQLAVEGVKNPDDCKFTINIAEILIGDVCEILPCTDTAIECIDGVPIWKK